MNIVALDKEFQKLELVENYINFRFEPKIKQLKGLKRHIFFDDLKNDFVNEVNTFGFSPYIQQTSDVQRKNKNIMSYKTNHMHDGLFNYVKLRNNDTKVINYRIDTNNEIKNKLKSRLQKSKSKKHLCQEEKKVDLISEKEADKLKNDNFLQKALENLARNKMNLSDDDSNLFSNNDKKISSSREKETGFDKFKMFYVNSLTYKVNLNPLVSISDYSKPNPLKAKFEKFFTNAKTLQGKEEIKKATGLFKNKDILFTIKKSKLLKSNSEQEENKEINRNDINLKSAIKIASQAKMSVFKRLSMVRPKTTMRQSITSHEKNAKLKQTNVDTNRIKHVINDDINEQQFYNLIDISPNNLFRKATTNLKCNTVRKSEGNIITLHK